MPYLSDPTAIEGAIARFSQRPRLWLDTEVADYNTSKPRLSLVQISDDPTDLKGDRAVIFDVLDCPEIIQHFIEQISLNPEIEKVFHNAKYDLTFLGQRQAQNVTCTLEMIQNIPYHLAPVPDYTLKTLAQHLCSFPPPNKTEQGGDWGQRPLTAAQLHYAQMDVVYVAQVHLRLLQLQQLAAPDPDREDLDALFLRYRQIEENWKRATAEMEHLQKRIKAAMQSQKIAKQSGFELKQQTRKTQKVPFTKLAQLTQDYGIDLNLSVTLTKKLQKELADFLEQLPIEEQVTTYARLKVAPQESDDKLPF
ncbi:MAG: ribonuclease D [Cyanobacteriota bacterium]|nr:ribonuclease D [Cyanobacteriota bacterium]